MEIEKAVEAADAVIVCLSNNSVSKEGYIQRELKFVLDIALEKSEGTIFVIPLRLDDVEPPRRLRSWQYVDYFPKIERSFAYSKLLESLARRFNAIDKSISVGINIKKQSKHWLYNRKSILYSGLFIVLLVFSYLGLKNFKQFFYCPGAPRSLTVGGNAIVVTSFDPLMLRPSPGNVKSYLEKLSPGTFLVVIEGPVCGAYYDEYFWWWKVRSPSGKVGWVVEGSDTKDPVFILPSSLSVEEHEMTQTADSIAMSALTSTVTFAPPPVISITETPTSFPPPTETSSSTFTPVQVSPTQQVNLGEWIIVVGSGFGSAQDAKVYGQQFVNLGYTIQIFYRDDRIRVVVVGFATEEIANSELPKIQTRNPYGYIRQLSVWCPYRIENPDYIQCQ